MTVLENITITHMPEMGQAAQWHVWIPPTGPECYEDGDVENGALIDQYGSSYWSTIYRAAAFIDMNCHEGAWA